MKRPPNFVIAGAVALVAFGLIVLAKSVMTLVPQVPWLTDEAAGFARAREQGKAVLIDMHASWSIPSSEVSHSLDKLRPIIDRDFVAVRLDISDGTNDSLRERYLVPTLPAVVIVDTEGRVIERIVRHLDEAEVRAVVERAARRFKRART